MESEEPIDVGETVPDVGATLVRPDGTAAEATLGELTADRPVLLSFYTVDFSPDCIDEWCSFRDFDWFSSGDHVQVVGCSKSSAGLHRRFIDYLGLNFPLFADPDLELSDVFGVTYRALGITRRSRRSCFLLDSELTVRYRWVSEHWLDPTRDTPPVHEIHEAISDELDVEGPETFGF
ncbi:redoxin domain-containing protein [Haloplanus halophilus]|uniref:redoxin domain-containing protein n=1 Tax=Haloplanus halophilus TaxID=2949993 RepID=UPI00203E40E3|nr:redoxin domain-containing protein [Haloplanus sp. GDY1]